MLSRCFHISTLIFALVAVGGTISAKDKHPKPPAQDEIQVVAHIPVTGGPIVRFMSTQHYRHSYLYAEQQSGKAVTLIDITNISSPAVVAQVSNPGGSADNLVAVTGNAALMAVVNKASGSELDPQTFRIMSFADPLHPAVQQEFKGVTAIAQDDKRSLIFLANSDGIWLLQQQFAPDPEWEKEWEHMMLDAR